MKNSNKSSENISFCRMPWSSLFLSSNGRVQPCCMNSTHLGNISKDSVEAIWNGEKLQNIRKLVGEKKYQEAGCALNCNVIYRLKNDTSPAILPEWTASSQKNEKFKTNLEIYGRAIKNRAAIINSTPIELDIQPNESCNMRCVMCNQQHDSKDKVTPESMRKLFAKHEHIYSTRFQGGEIFLYPDFTSFLIELKQKFSEHQILTVITNASTISFDEIDKLTSGNNPVRFTVSIDSIYENTYESIRRTKQFKKVMQNLEYMSKIQKDKNLNFLTWNFVVMKSNFYQIKETIDLATRLGIEIYFQAILGDHPEENIFEYHNLRDDGFGLYIDECIQMTTKLNSRVLNLKTIKDKLAGLI